MESLIQQNRNDKGRKGTENETLRKNTHLCIFPIASFGLMSRGFNQIMEELLSLMLSIQWYSRMRSGQA